MKAKTFSLYWCDTEDHEADAFVVAASHASAQDYFALSEECDPTLVTVELIARLPESETRLREWRDRGGWGRGAGHPSRDLLRLCGGASTDNGVLFEGREFPWKGWP